MTKTVISTDKAPAAIGPYSQAIVHGDLVFCAGQIPLDPATGQIVEGDTVVQA
jgi:2-iminobutanoate/2-iminopropanoate deaminase